MYVPAMFIDSTRAFNSQLANNDQNLTPSLFLIFVTGCVDRHGFKSSETSLESGEVKRSHESGEAVSSVHGQGSLVVEFNEVIGRIDAIIDNPHL